MRTKHCPDVQRHVQLLFDMIYYASFSGWAWAKPNCHALANLAEDVFFEHPSSLFLVVLQPIGCIFSFKLLSVYDAVVALDNLQGWVFWREKEAYEGSNHKEWRVDAAYIAKKLHNAHKLPFFNLFLLGRKNFNFKVMVL